MKHLDPIQLPLNTSVLIEASAGTGKTFTIANIYLRLVLGVGCLPLTVEQILVVTFTKASTEELKDRIRKNIQQCADFLRDKNDGVETQSSEKSYRNNVDFLEQLYPQITDIHTALLRLSIAEREIDVASVFTIHGFCQKMLVQFAFESGVRFDLDLQPNQSELLKRLSEDVWREQFYPQGITMTEVVSEELSTPENALNAVKHYLSADLPEPNALFAQDFDEHLAKYQQFIAEVKSDWLANGEALVEAIRDDLDNKKTLHGGWYRKDTFEAGVLVMNQWASSPNRYFPNEFYLFTTERIASGTKKSCEPMDLPQLAKNQDFLTAYQQQFEGSLAAILQYQFLMALREKLTAYKQNHSARSFDDLLTMLNQALKQPETGEKLAQKIRSNYPFAMIDEFQDTDLTQYEIFSRIFMAENQNHGFIMIGDPKQSIYKFRGADIFTYLKASKQAKAQFTLGKNWRSLPAVVQAVNNLFNFANAEKSPFLYQDIAFHPVEADESKGNLVSEQGYFVCYLSEHCYGDKGGFKENELAKMCAYHIYQQLEQMKQGKLGIEKIGKFTPFAAKDITILVRSAKQAQLIKQALNERNIKSVYFSERNSVFDSLIAEELLWVLKASLNPYDSKALMSALGSTLWGFTAAELYHYKNNEMLWESKVNEFIHYNDVWKTQGILPMLHKLYLEQGIIQRLKGMQNADRLLTDLLHLTEIFQETQQQCETESELVRWYEQKLLEPDSENDEQNLRLESEDELVKIVTIHGSKGLQYPIVWLPFVAKINPGYKRKAINLLRDENGENQWAVGSLSDDEKAQLNNEEYAEDLRLLYVALTRAESQINLILPTVFGTGWNGLHYLLANSHIPSSDDKNKPKPKPLVKDYFLNKNITSEENFIELAEQLPEGIWQNDELEQNYSAKTFEGNIRVVGQITSFTSLYAQHERLSEGKMSLVADLAQDRDANIETIETDYSNVTEPFSPYQFPHGMKVGTILHSFFEHCAFGEPINAEQVAKLCEQLELGEEWLEPTTQWFEQILATNFGEPAFCLKQIADNQRLNEWHFYLRLKNDKALVALNHLLKKYSTLAKQLPDLQLPQLEGFVRGFVDCIAKINGKFYVLDYKSNFLGYLPQNYSLDTIKQEMGRQRYDLQYLLYTLAVHRYLASRLGDNYDYDRDFGGVAYLFLRGMNGENDSGVYFNKPSRELIEEMDTLFG